MRAEKKKQLANRNAGSSGGWGGDGLRGLSDDEHTDSSSDGSAEEGDAGSSAGGGVKLSDDNCQRTVAGSEPTRKSARTVRSSGVNPDVQ